MGKHKMYITSTFFKELHLYDAQELKAKLQRSLGFIHLKTTKSGTRWMTP